MQHCGVFYLDAPRWANFLPVKSYVMYIIMCVFTYTCSQKHNNLSDSITV